MKLETILDHWQNDKPLDKTALDDEAIRCADLHEKYLRIWSNERTQLLKLNSDLKTLELEKYEFYTQGPSKETAEKGWTMPAKGMILKADIDRYMEADPDLVKAKLRIGLQKEKVSVLDSIMEHIRFRGNLIKTATEFIKWQSGS